LVAFTLVSLTIQSTQARGSNSDYSEFLQALVEHHIQVLPRNVERDADIRCLALNIFHESRGEPIIGQLAVANVTMNRFNDSTRTICQIVYSPGQFEWTSKRLRNPGGEQWFQALALSWLVLNQPDLVRDVTRNAKYFHSYRRTPGSFRRFEHTTTIGNHRFYRERPLEEVAQAPQAPSR
jgi:spore germination cell wall hydrolase CwlJ-like protein